MAQQIPTGDAATAAAVQNSPVDWASIFAGVAVAMAISLVLFAFGSAIGLSLGSVEAGEGVSLVWISIASGIWFIWVVITAFAAGGYCAGRLRRATGLGVSADEIETRDGAHGVIVWAVGTVLAGILAANGIAGVTGAAANATGGAVATVAETVSETATGLGSRLTRGGNGDTAALQAEAGQIASVISEAAMSDEGLTEEDRTYLVDTVAANTDLTPEEVNARIDDAMAQAQDVRETAVEAVETARVATSIGAFIIAATLMVAAAAAYFAAAAGGSHREQNTPFSRLRF